MSASIYPSDVSRVALLRRYVGERFEIEQGWLSGRCPRSWLTYARPARGAFAFVLSEWVRMPFREVADHMGIYSVDAWRLASFAGRTAAHDLAYMENITAVVRVYLAFELQRMGVDYPVHGDATRIWYNPDDDGMMNCIT